jgi:hypothetical protein
MRTLSWGAINPHTGRPYTWGDPNLRWGSPSYALEPGDPGFVPYPSASQNKPKPKTRPMKHNNWYPIRVAEQILWLQNFVAKLAGHAAALGISTTDTAARLADARWLIYVLGTWLPAVRAWQQSCTQAMQAAQTGTASGTLVLPVFTPPPLPGVSGDLPAVVSVPEGALHRIFETINDVRPAASAAVQEDLRIVGTQQTGPDFDTFAPKLTAEATTTGVKIGWGWQGFSEFLDQCEIEVDRSDTQGWTLLTYDTTPGYKDTTPLPTLTKWKYRAIYRVDDARVGQWSAEVSVTVGG